MSWWDLISPLIKEFAQAHRISGQVLIAFLYNARQGDAVRAALGTDGRRLH